MVAELFKNEMCQLVLGHPVHIVPLETKPRN